MKFISHRGNIKGTDPSTENTPGKIDYVISLNLDIEIDLWCINQQYYLGHDSPKTLIDKMFLTDRAHNLWIHCKNLECLYTLLNTDFNFFWHQEDDVTLTSKRYIWSYPKPQNGYFSNMVCLDFSSDVNYNFYRSHNIHALCCDYIENLI